MKRLTSWLNIIMKKRRELKRWQRIVTVLAAIITFATTYALILPAITVERDNTENVGGMYLEQREDQEELFEKNALEFTGVSIAADQENAVAYEYADDDMTAIAVFSTDEEIPEGSELVVNPVAPESEEYADLNGRAAVLLDKESIYDVTTCSFYDFALILDGVDVTPKTGLVDVQINFMNNTVEHVDDVVYAGRFGRAADATEGFADVSDELVSSNPDESTVIELNDSIITVLSLKGNDLALTDRVVGILAGYVDEEAAPSVKTLKATGDDYTVVLTYDESSKIPEGAFLTASEISQDSKEYMTYLEETKKAMGLTEEDTLPRFAARFFDIKIMVGDEEFSPKTGVSVEITYTEPLAEKADAEVSAVHFADEKADAEVIEANTTEIQDDGAATVEFTAESFSVYGVVYTVDFHYEVDGKMYEFSIPGGGFVTLQQLVEVLGIANSDTYSENASDGAGNSGDFTEDVDDYNIGEVPGVVESGAYAEDGDDSENVGEEQSVNNVATYLDVAISEKTREFIADVESVEFSSPELVWVGKVDGSATVGGLKDANGLDVQYSTELTEDQIDEINEQTVENGDWALINVQPFATEESLTVTMKTGEVFTVSVTDAQIIKDFITASGETYTITVTYNDAAVIPDGADLEVEELLPGTDKYTEFLRKSAERLNIVSSDLSFARFFDITIVDKNGEKVEPKVPVRVEIKYKDAVEIGESQSLNIVHFAENGTEIISNAVVSEDGKEITYQQTSFSVTGTIISGQPSNGDQRMIIIKDGTRYFIVNNDASLTEVGFSEGTGSNGEDEVIVTDPMLWTFESSGGNNHIYFNSEATGFGTNLIASDYYRRYLDPSSDTAWLQEQSTDNSKSSYVTVTLDGTFVNNGETVETNHINDPWGRLNPLNATNITYSGDTISHDDGSYRSYFAIERDAAGTPVRLVGGKNQDDPDVAHFMYATASKVPSGLHLDNAVNHIDISIAGDAQVNVPLAYGDYYDADGNIIKSVTENTKLTLTQNHVPDDLKDMLKITTDDMKRATITARDQEGNELDDVFYVTGFSANTSTDVSTVQVRIEGRFLCSDLRGTQYEHVDGNRYDGNFGIWPPQWPDSNYVNAVRQARLSNIVEYNVTVIKPVTFNLVDPVVGQLYDVDHNPIQVTVDCAFSGNFNYWDYGQTAKNSGNECPPVQGNADWRQGDIPNHDMSGMDFVLSGDAENENSPLVAIEITKIIRDEEGNTIKVSVPVTNTFDIYQNKTANRNGVADYNVESYDGEDDSLYSGYTKLRSRNITVDDRGSALIYDYNVTDGMYYITEQKDTVPETVTDQSGNEYTYVKTYIETEYVRRGNKYDDKTTYPDPMHISADYTKEDDEYRSSPEVVGYFNTLTGERKKSAFLEFYVYNIYTSGKDLPVEKVWAEGTDAPDNVEVTVELWYKARKIKDSNGNALETPGEWSDPAKVVNGEGGFSGITTELTLKADTSDEAKNWKGEFKDLPNTVTREDGEYEVDYLAKETAVTIEVSGSDINVIGDYKVTLEIKDGVTIITNAKEPTRLEVEKKWMSDDETEMDAPEGAEVTVKLMFASRKIKNSDGSTPESIPEWEDCTYKEVATEDPDTGTRTFDSMFTGDPLLDAATLEGIITSITLKADEVDETKSWKGAFENLPKTVVNTSGEVYEIDYTAEEDGVTIQIPGSDTTYVDEHAVDVTGNYDITVIKTEGSDDETNPTDDKVAIVNTKKKVTPRVTKVWDPDPEDDQANAVVELRRYKKKVTAKTKTVSTVRKVWNDSSAPEGVRPDNITVSLYRDEETTPIATETLNAGNNWTVTRQNLSMYKLDAEDQETDEAHVYKWVETSTSTEYSASYAYNGNTTIITNTYSPSQTNLTVEKIWEDADNQDGKRPENLTVNLMKEGSTDPVKTVILNEANGWKAESGLVPTREADRTPISYSWVETNVPDGYTPGETVTVGTVTTLTNAHRPETTEAEIQVVWEAGENAAPPENGITVTLSNGDSAVLNSGNNWHAKIENLPKYYNGTEFSYTWNVPNVDGYDEPAVSKTGTVTTVTYTPEPEKDTVLVTLYTELSDNLPEGWNVNIYNVTVNGTNISDQLGNMYMTSYSLRPILFEVPKNSTISYHYEVSDGIRLNGVASNDVTTRSFSVNEESGSRDVKFKVGTHDANVYNVITDRSVTLNPDIIPDPKYMNVTINLIKESGINSPYFGCNPPLNGAYRDNETGVDFGWTAQQNGENHWKKDNARVQTDLDDNITYLFNSFGYWNLESNDAVVLTSNAQLTYNGTTGNTFVFTDNSFSASNEIGLVAQEGDVTIDVRVVPRSSLQNTSQAAGRKSLQKTGLLAASLRAQVNGLVKGDDSLQPEQTSGQTLSESGLESALPSSISLNTAVKRNTKAAPVRRGSSDAAAPEGYETDSGFTPIQHTLDKNGWSYTYPEQDKYDENGNEYIYEIVEISHYPTEYHTESITGDPLSETGVIITNVKEQKGSISVTKSAAGLEAGETKTYQIGVKDASGKYYKLDGTEADTAPYYVTFNSNETKTWADLPEGSYTVEEDQTAAGVEGYTLAVSGTGNISVTGGGTSSVTVTNTYTKNPGNLELTKKVAGDGADTNKEFVFTIELTAPGGKTLAETYQYTKTGADGEQTLTLSRTDGNTKATVSGINLKAEDVYTIIGLPAGTSYKITESDYSSEGYSSSLPAEGQSGTITGGTTAKESVEVTNTLGKGRLTVEKTVDGNASDSTKDFEFSVVFEKTGLNGISGSYKKGTAETIGTAESNNITFANGSATVTFTLKGGEKAEFTDLPNGTAFTVSETSKDADGYETTVSSTGGTVNDSDKTVTGSISSTAAVTASYINTRETTTVEASKEWKAGEQTVNWPEDVDQIEFTLYKTVNGQTSAVSADDAEGIVNPALIISTTEGKKAVWSDLPTRYLVEGTWYDAVYTVKETRIVYNEKSGRAEADRNVTVDIAAAENAGQAQGTHQFTVTNELETTSIHVTKEWKNKDDQVLDGTSGKEIPAEARVKFTLYNGDNAVTVMTGGQPVNRAVELNGQDATKGGTVTPDADDYEANWVAYFTHLPKYDADGQIIAYTVRETGTWTGYTVVGSNTASNEGKITNKEKTVTLDIVKVEKDSNKPLENAVFKLYKINETSASLDQDPTTEQTATTNDKGQTSFSNLTIGYYIVTETNTPTGYVITGEDSFYIEVTDNGIVLLTKGEGAPNTWEKNAVSYGNVKTFTAASTDKNAQATVENTPGAALPHTGGSGTMLYYLMGLMLIAVAGIGAVMKLRLGR